MINPAYMRLPVSNSVLDTLKLVSTFPQAYTTAPHY